MIIYSKVLNTYSNLFLIKLLRDNKFFWNYKFFFEHLSLKHYLKLAKSLMIRSHKVVFVQIEGLSHHWYYRRPTMLADFNFGYPKGKKSIYWNALLDEYASQRFYHPTQDYKLKSVSNLIPKVCFISSNSNKIARLQNNYPDLYKELDIYGEFHKPIDSKLNLTETRHTDSLSICAKYFASLAIENCEEEGYAQGIIFYSLACKTPPILKAQPSIKNFIRSEYYIDFYSYLTMTNQKKVSEINKLQERLFIEENYLTNLAQDYINFIKESFSGDNDPDINKIILQSQYYREKFIKT